MNSFLLMVVGAPLLVLFALALPPAVCQKSWLRFLVALPLSFAVVVLPLFVFLASGFLIPEGKDGCLHGWLDCFGRGKLALTPLALLATAALYSVEVLGVNQPVRNWIALGVFLGAMISNLCLWFGLLFLRNATGAVLLWFLVPLYIALWYSIRAVQLIKWSAMRPRAYLVTLLGSLPFWIGSVWWSQAIYASLPDKSPNCFIVTAAGRGHKRFVGPFMAIQHRGRQILANQQLLTFWQFEGLWRTGAPCSHKYFRWFYNRFGPAIASRIQSPWLADLAYAAIKPFELAAKLAISTCEEDKNLKV